MDTGLDALKIASKKAVHKAGGFLGNKSADPEPKSNDNKIVKVRNNWRNNYSTKKKRWNFKQIKTSVIITLEHYEISKFLNNSTLSKVVTKKWIEVNDSSIWSRWFIKMIFQVVNILATKI